MVSRPRSNPPLWKTVDPEIFDRAFLSRFTLESEELEREIIDLFLVQLPETLAMLNPEADAAQWRFGAHALKGSAAAVGARRVAAAARRLEAVAEDAGERQRLLSELQQAVSQFRVAVADVHPQR